VWRPLCQSPVWVLAAGSTGTTSCRNSAFQANVSRRLPAASSLLPTRQGCPVDKTGSCLRKRYGMPRDACVTRAHPFGHPTASPHVVFSFCGNVGGTLASRPSRHSHIPKCCRGGCVNRRCRRSRLLGRCHICRVSVSDADLFESAVVAGVSPATIQGIAAGTAASTENGLIADTANDATI
jgi:hypothetical protein